MMSHFVCSLDTISMADLLLLGGLVLEQGAVTQHAATTAREYGVPAVVAVAGATQRIQDGAWVRVDGVTGVVVLEAPEHSSHEAPPAASRSLA
jgi:phosphohistidine swiveling domain-containing protein